MTYAFEFTPSTIGGTVRLSQSRLLGRTLIAPDKWGKASKDIQPAARRLLSLVENGHAAAGPEALDVSAEGLLSLPSGLAKLAGLPPTSSLVLCLELGGRVEAPDGRIKISWQDGMSRHVTPRVTGIIAESADGKRRLSAPVFRLLTAISEYNSTVGQSDRISPWLGVQEHLQAITGAGVKTDALLGKVRIFQAGAFGLDIREAVGGPVFDPVLMGQNKRLSLLDDTPSIDKDAAQDSEPDIRDNETDALLTPRMQQEFVRAFAADGLGTRPSYVLAPNSYLVIEPDLRDALDVVKKLRREPEAARRSFLRNPRTFLASALPDLGDAAGSIFVETQQYSERVKGLGLWEKPKLDWLQRKSSGWLPESFTLPIGAKSVAVDEQKVAELASLLELATERGDQIVAFGGDEHATTDVVTALDGLRKQFDEDATPYGTDISAKEDPAHAKDANVLLIDDHIEAATYEESLRPRRQELPVLFPSDLVTTDPKLHQQVGFRWLVQAWSRGLPGALLADDMGLGKTMQALAFLAWFRANRRAAAKAGKEFEGPILIVAPTALLRNWRNEAATHLTEDALGDCLEAFGTRLKDLKAKFGPGWTPEDALDVGRIRQADWVLTTFETLATYHRAFARAPYAVVIFDEMQKIKAPDTINTHAAKTLNAHFVIGMTGTPIENRIEDLWCIMDRVAPGYLGGMKAFSKMYGGEDQDALKSLKAKLDQPVGKVPPVMLRRMKIDHLAGLPERRFDNVPRDMPPLQAEAYDAVVRAAKSGAMTKQLMLQTIHQLRGISLHPQGGGDVDITSADSRRAWIEASARVSETMAILRRIERAGEKALVFIEDRAVQATFAAVVAEEFNLTSLPPIINGSLDGDKRQAVVDRFQASKPGFGLLVLSPKAAGIGLTITAANHVIHLSRWWNPAVEDQCNDRAYRIGQLKPVTVHVPIARHPGYREHSFDMKLDALLERKRTLSRDMLVPPVWEGDVDDLFASTVAEEEPAD